MSVAVAVLIVASTGFLGAIILVVASKFMSVVVDERIEQISAVLPAVNCGACGFAGCADYATGIVENNVAVNLCVPGGASTADDVAGIMGTVAGEVAQYKAIIACQGSSEYTTDKYNYSGLASCATNAVLHGGYKSCSYGCLGFGDCVRACKFGAISVNDGIARVNPDLCTGCGACEEACPKRVIWIREVSEKPVVMCANHHRGAATRKECTAGCIGCKKCEKTCPDSAIVVTENVARIDLEKCTGCRACVNICPVKAIAIPKAV